MTVTCYPSPGKKKGLKICTAFAKGCGGRVMPEGHPTLEPGPAFFYGWTEYTWPLMRQCVQEGRTWFYADNAYYYGKGRQFRVTRCALMHDGSGPLNEAALRERGVRFKPWSKDGRHIVIATQSRGFYELRMGITRELWTAEVVDILRPHTDREIVVCDKPERWSGHPHVNFEEALRGAWAVVSHSSSCMVKAVVAGIPVFSVGPSMASSVGLDDLARIETPHRPEDDQRCRWLSQLLANQWTYREMEDGTCWSGLSKQQSCSLDLAKSIVSRAA